jgi:hypothetical protein
MDISYEKILYRIIKGRLRIKLGDLILHVQEPTDDVLEESYDIYDEAYNKAYFNNVFLKKDLKEILFYRELWSPDDDKRIKELDKKIEDLKVEAYKSHFDRKKLQGIKGHIRFFEKERAEITAKNQSLDHISCEGLADFARSAWIIEMSTIYGDGSNYDWDYYSVSDVMGIVSQHTINPLEFRMIARNDPWRSMWMIGKTSGNLLGKCSTEFTVNQTQLCSYSFMYDNVYESHERPNDKIVEDDDCLDGWFIVQRRKHEKEKKQQEVDALTSNPKIANSQEVFVMASSQESANEIYDLNDPIAMSTIKQRNAQIDQVRDTTGGLDFRQLHDIKQDMAIQGRQEGLQKMRGK